MKYISKQGEDNVVNFKYKGGSASILYEHLWSPLSQGIVDYIMPSFVAPNLITMIGFINIIFAHFILVYYSPDYKTQIPSWAFYYGGISVLIYQVLDNVDGKQARKTQSSSPLGMLFDHGCDTTTTWLISLMLCQAIQLNNGYYLLTANTLISFLGFFFPMWAQLHCGVFQLSRINAVDEGLVGVELLLLSTGLFGQGIWKKVLFFHYTSGDILVFVVTVTSLFHIFQQILETTEVKRLDQCLDTLVAPLFLLITLFILYWKSQSLSQQWYLYVYALGLLWSKMVGHIQLSHISKDSPNQFSLAWLLLLFMLIANVLIGESKIIPQTYFLYGVITYAFIVYLYFCCSVITHLANLLNINVFTIKKVCYSEISN